MNIHKDDLFREEDFRKWLGSEENMNRKCTNDVVSRCKRIQTEFRVDIAHVVEQQDSYNILFNQIKTRILEKSAPVSSPSIVYGVLRRSLRLYAKFLKGNHIDYPKGYLRKPKNT